MVDLGYHKDCDSYVALVPRGIEHVVAEMVQLQLQTQYYVTTTLLGEPDDREGLVASIRDQLQVASTKHPNGKLIVESTCSVVVGTVEVPPNQHVSMGYSSYSANVWTLTGQIPGTVWMEITTNAPARTVAEIRCIGPILALVTCYHDLDLSTGQTLERASQEIQRVIHHDDTYHTRFQSALRLWRKNVHECWPVEVMESNHRHLGMIHAAAPLQYRVSCLRSDSKRYPYTRRELLRSVDCVVPSSSPYDSFSVNLTKYDLEIVLLHRSDCLLIGFALRPYQWLNTRSFASGELPPDTSAPFLSSIPRIVRLRSTTAQVLLHLAQLQPGDVVLDPCAGIGTIPIEAYFLNRAVLGIGGDLIMNDPFLNAVAVEYIQKASACLRQDPPNSRRRAPYSARNQVADLMAWDATCLPMRSESIDAIVTDLPFGQLCLSAAKLDAFLPLVLAEMARVLRRRTGRLVLLCGSYLPILRALHDANDRLLRNECALLEKSLIWDVPSTAVFPVNIGGNLAWIIQVRRGCGALGPIPGQRERIRKQVHKREHTEKMIKGSKAIKLKHPQS